VDDLVAIIEDYADPQRLWERHVRPALKAQNWEVLQDQWAVYELTKHPKRLRDVIAWGLLPLWKYIMVTYATSEQERTTIDKSTFCVMLSSHLVVFEDVTRRARPLSTVLYDVVPYLMATATVGLPFRLFLGCLERIPDALLGYAKTQMRRTGLFAHIDTMPLGESHCLGMKLQWKHVII